MLSSRLIRCAAIASVSQLPGTSIAGSSGTTVASNASSLEVKKCPEDVLERASKILRRPYQVVDSPTLLEEAVASMRASATLAVDVEACVTHDVSRPQLGEVSLIQCAASGCEKIFLVDVMSLGKDAVRDALSPVLTNEAVEKQFFDCRRDVEAFSSQLGIVTKGALDLQLLFTGSQWKLKSLNRRSGMGYVLKTVANVTRQETDAAVQLAMTKGNRAVWDVRPLPEHFLEYAAGDVRHTLLLGIAMEATHGTLLEGARRLTTEYVRYYAAGKQPVEVEIDTNPAEVSVEWLEMFFGPGGVCAHCRQPGHLENECFRKAAGTAKCSHCGGMGHLAKNCYKRFPEKLKCAVCGQLGHTQEKCFKKNPCKHCGGGHAPENCRQRR